MLVLYRGLSGRNYPCSHHMSRQIGSRTVTMIPTAQGYIAFITGA